MDGSGRPPARARSADDDLDQARAAIAVRAVAAILGPRAGPILGPGAGPAAAS